MLGMIVAIVRNDHPEVGMRSSEPEMARAILLYLMEHKEAADTTEGIMRWWILNDKMKQRLSMIQEALDFLLSKGWIRHRCLLGTTERVYSLEPSKMDQIQFWLKNAR
jgi:hypothetical protein